MVYLEFPCMIREKREDGIIEEEQNKNARRTESAQAVWNHHIF
jgi:hypothetical protein